MTQLVPVEFVMLTSVTLGALGRRMAGGQLSRWLGVTVPDQAVRILWGACLALVAFLAGLVWWQALAMIPLIWAGSTAGMNGAMTMGRKSGRSIWIDAALMLLYGLLCLAPLGAAALWLGYGWAVLFLIAAAILCPISYEVAWLFPLHAEWLGCAKDDPPPTGELLWGGYVGLAIAFLVLTGG